MNLYRSDPCRTAVGLAVIHLAFETKDPAVRREALESISRTMISQPRVMSQIMREALFAWFKAQDEQATGKAKAVITEEDEPVTSKSRNIGRLLRAIFIPSASMDKATLEDIAVDYLVLSHHPEITEDAQVSWIGLVQSMSLNPATIAIDRQEEILKLLWEAADVPPQVRHFTAASWLISSGYSSCCSRISCCDDFGFHLSFHLRPSNIRSA